MSMKLRLPFDDGILVHVLPVQEFYGRLALKDKFEWHVSHVEP